MGQFPNPSTQFKPGQSGNPGGKSAAHRQAEVDAAEAAAKSRLAAVQAFANLMNGCATDEDRAALVSSDVLRLWKESEDRGFGSPQQHIDNTSSDGSMTPVAQYGDAVLEALNRKHAQNTPESDGEAP